MIDSLTQKSRDIELEASWKKALAEEFSSDYMIQLRNFLLRQKQAGKQIFPPGSEIFNALNLTSIENCKLIILGQDPYHGAGQAHGLCFSVKPGVAVPPSLMNIYKELKSDIGCIAPDHGCLEFWAEQGVLLLNAVLTVEAGNAASHQGKGWEMFTDKIVEVLNTTKSGLVFLLWGSYAQKKGAMIDRKKHLVLESPHPSPLSASRGFFGNKHFSRANEYLIMQGGKPIEWQLP